MMKIIEDGNVTSAKGFKAAGDFIGIKKAKKDLALISSDTKATAAACFTTNIVKAAPVQWGEKIIGTKGKVSGIVVNSGNANACTGKKGVEDNFKIAETYGKLLNVPAEEVFVCSTGVIGVNLPIDIITKGIETVFGHLSHDKNAGDMAATAILTTDTFMKTVAVQIELGGKTVTIGGMAKGSGMIHPNMATMLSFITTDVNISRDMLDKALKDSTADTYNMISVDGDTSTNDTVLALANGMAENTVIDTPNKDYETFFDALNYVNKKLAIDIIRDGEGASKLMEVTVTGAVSKDDAKKIVKSVVSSSLFKAALFGADANWGRVLCAMGYSNGVFNPDAVTIVFKSSAGSIKLMDSGTPIVFDEALAASILAEKDIFIDIILEEGTHTATAWGCDLTYDYVKINGDYRS